MKTNYIIFILITTIFFGCEKPRNEKKQIEEELNATPDILIDSTDYFDLKGFSRYRTKIIEQLFKEATDKNIKLELLMDKIELTLGEEISDETKDIHNYLKTNSEYWNDVNYYLNNINDSIVKKQTKKFFQKQENSYSQNIKNHQHSLEELESKKQTIKDQVILIKLAITGKMMNNFQKNELPDIKILQNLNSKLDSVILETNEFSKLN